VRALSGYRLDVHFDDGTAGEIELVDRLFGPVFEPLKDEKMFNQVFVDEFGAIAWPCGPDLAPDGVYRRLTAVSAPSQ
jgi:tRNA U34 5-methylaminomethyl-2-thiouridine-forming methyltransferase MnmC